MGKKVVYKIGFIGGSHKFVCKDNTVKVWECCRDKEKKLLACFDVSYPGEIGENELSLIGNAFIEGSKAFFEKYFS